MAYRLGIDLGTTDTVAAVTVLGGAAGQLLALDGAEASIASVVYVDEAGQLLTGPEAVRRAVQDPARAIADPRRLLGSDQPYEVGGDGVTPEDAIAAVLRYVHQQATRQHGEPPVDTVVGYPSAFTEYQLECLDNAVAAAGIGATQRCSDAEAALAAYASREPVAVGTTVLVYDLGGGSCDVSVLRTTTDGRRVIEPGQHSAHPCGADFDEAVFRLVLSNLGGRGAELTRDDAASQRRLSDLKRACTQAKEILSEAPQAQVNVALASGNTTVKLGRQEFTSLVRPGLRDSVAMISRVLGAAGVRASDLGLLIMVGGCCRMPVVAEILGREFDVPIGLSNDPDEDVALGLLLATQAPVAPPPAPQPEPVAPQPAPVAPQPAPVAPPPAPVAAPVEVPAAADSPAPQPPISHDSAPRPPAIVTGPLAAAPPYADLGPATYSPVPGPFVVDPVMAAWQQRPQQLDRPPADQPTVQQPTVQHTESAVPTPATAATAATPVSAQTPAGQSTPTRVRTSPVPPAADPTAAAWGAAELANAPSPVRSTQPSQTTPAPVEPSASGGEQPTMPQHLIFDFFASTDAEQDTIAGPAGSSQSSAAAYASAAAPEAASSPHPPGYRPPGPPPPRPGQQPPGRPGPPVGPPPGQRPPMQRPGPGGRPGMPPGPPTQPYGGPGGPGGPGYPPGQGGDDSGGGRRKLILIIAGAVVGVLLIAAAVFAVVKLRQPTVATPPTLPPASTLPATPIPSTPPPSESPTATPTPGGQTTDPALALPKGPALPASIVVVPMRRGGDQGRPLYLVDTDGKINRVQLPVPEGNNSNPLLPRGRDTVIYLHQGALRVMASDGTGDRELFDRDPAGCEKIEHASWSVADPNVLVVTCGVSKNKDTLLVVGMDGRLIRRLDVGKAIISDPSISPDGQTVLFWASDPPDRDGGALFTMPIIGTGAPKQLTDSGPGVDADGAWSPDGSQIAFRRRVPNGTAAGNSNVFVMNSDGSAEEAVANGKAADDKPNWSPDGENLLILSNRKSAFGGPGKTQDLWLTRISDGEVLTSLGLKAKQITRPFWTSR